MADRPSAPPRPLGAGITKSRGGGITAASVRRNLFQSQLTRRPTTGSASSGSAETLRLEGGVGGAGAGISADGQQQQQQQQQPPPPPESTDIVVRDKNGEVELGDPPTPPIDDPDELVLDARQENEKERQRLAEQVKQHQIDQNSVPAQPEGIYTYVPFPGLYSACSYVP
jgi:hypothetical protein